MNDARLNGQRSAPRPLLEVPSFGSNPGHLKAWLHLPDLLGPRPPLVVALHGCTQSAEGYASGTGWNTLADRHGFAVLYPEQQRTNNANLCFNWFQPGDIARGKGEAASIRQMIAHVAEAHGVDPARIFVTGLSAGGAMANVMLAAYPEVFAAGAIIAGLPYGTASTVGEAFDRMRGRGAPGTAELRTRITTAAHGSKTWPRVSVWHGSHDHTVMPRNADIIVDQWRSVMAVGKDAVETPLDGGHRRSVWRDAKGREIIESYLVKGMAHGVPLAAGAEAPLGEVGAFMLETGLSSTARIAEFWGLIGEADRVKAEGGAAAPGPRARAKTHTPLPALGVLMAPRKPKARAGAKAKPDGKAETAPKHAPESGITKVINDAFRAAGLIR